MWKIISKENKKKIRNNILFIMLLFFKFFLYDLSIVPSSSMTPSFLTGDCVVVKKYYIRWSLLTIPYGGIFKFGKKGFLFKLPEKGTPCVFTMPKDPYTYYLKRVIAYEGDTVQMINGLLHINNEPVKMKFVKNFRLLNDENEYETGKIYKITLKNGRSYNVYRNKKFGRGHIDNTPKYTVPKGYVWMQGDNHTGSSDSFSIRFLGPLPIDHLISVPVFIVINSKSRGTQEESILWLLFIPYNIVRYFWNLDYSRYMITAN